MLFNQGIRYELDHDTGMVIKPKLNIKYNEITIKIDRRDNDMLPDEIEIAIRQCPTNTYVSFAYHDGSHFQPWAYSDYSDLPILEHKINNYDFDFKIVMDKLINKYFEVQSSAYVIHCIGEWEIYYHQHINHKATKTPKRIPLIKDIKRVIKS